MARRGWLDGDGGKGRGRDAYVPLDWDRASILSRARSRASAATSAMPRYSAAPTVGRAPGASTMRKASCSASSAWRAASPASGTIYSYAAGLAVLPHILGGVEAAAGPVTDWPSIVEHTGLMVSFGGLPVKNAQVDSGGNGEHAAAAYIRAAGRRGVGFVAVSPLGDDLPPGLGGEWIPIRPAPIPH